MVQNRDGSLERAQALQGGVPLDGDPRVAVPDVAGVHSGEGFGEGHHAVLVPELRVGEAFEGGAVVLADPSPAGRGADDADLLVVAQGRHRQAEQLRHLADRIQAFHARALFSAPPLALKCT
ncbi:hypothetical protein BJF79_04525 [Actinomadura sp. CNU-125]|nr:hypothetical protein BJF79_04525 [Actinomadura sp. CNU-125]